MDHHLLNEDYAVWKKTKGAFTPKAKLFVRVTKIPRKVNVQTQYFSGRRVWGVWGDVMWATRLQRRNFCP